MGGCRQPLPLNKAGTQAPIQVTVCTFISLETPSLHAYLDSGQKPMSLNEQLCSSNLKRFILSFLKPNFADQILLGRAELRPARLLLKKCEEKQ